MTGALNQQSKHIRFDPGSVLLLRVPGPWANCFTTLKPQTRVGQHDFQASAIYRLQSQFCHFHTVNSFGMSLWANAHCHLVFMKLYVQYNRFLKVY